MTSAEKTRAYTQRRYAAIEQMPKIPCACGCGELIPPINRRLKPARYKSGHQPGWAPTQFRPGNTETARRGGLALGAKRRAAGLPREYVTRGGYMRKYIDRRYFGLWPTARLYGGTCSIMRSHYVWNSAHPNDLVGPGYQIHHINGVRNDDRLKNLQKVTIPEHYAIHQALGSHVGLGTGPRKTACLRGHPYELYRRYPANGRGDSWCVECCRIKAAARRVSARASVTAV